MQADANSGDHSGQTQAASRRKPPETMLVRMKCRPIANPFDWHKERERLQRLADAAEDLLNELKELAGYVETYHKTADVQAYLDAAYETIDEAEGKGGAA